MSIILYNVGVKQICEKQICVIRYMLLELYESLFFCFSFLFRYFFFRLFFTSPRLVPSAEYVLHVGKCYMVCCLYMVWCMQHTHTHTHTHTQHTHTHTHTTAPSTAEYPAEYRGGMLQKFRIKELKALLAAELDETVTTSLSTD